MAGQRPGGVTLVAVIIWIWALLDVVFGVLSVLALWIPAIIIDLGWGLGVLWNGIVSIVFGVIGFLIAGGLLRGSRLARALVTIWLVLSLIGAVVALVNGSVLAGVISLVVAILGILLLWAGKAARFFSRA
ncbi:MAG: hypothetical protein BGO95_09330 [Micrococcales bacterium 73-13]|nr:MAG: hypothetical protein BGO95_09330 [Micrococcales bacterium 73-13]